MSTKPPSIGERSVAAIREYLSKTGAKWSHLNGETVAKIIDEAFAKPKKGPKMIQADSDWLAELKSDPALVGIDIDRELSLAQKWARDHGRLCTRNFFMRWIQKAERVLGPGRVAVVSLPELKGWRQFLEKRKAEGMLGMAIPATWEEMDIAHRKMIHGMKSVVKTIGDYY